MKLSEIAARLDCNMVGGTDPEITGVAGIDQAGPGELTFVSNRKYVRSIKTTRAAAIILGFDIEEVAIPSLRTSNPYLAFARALEIFYQPPRPQAGIHPSAVIAEGVRIGSGASIGAYVTIAEGCVIGANATLHPHVTLYPRVSIGDDTVLHSHVVIREHCFLGNRVVLQNGVVIGADGFGFAPADDGTYRKIPQSGRVLVEDDVEIGANSTVDRAAVGDTIVRRGAKLDNLVQVGHGAQVGESCVIAAQVGLAGSTRLGKGVQVGGQAGFAGHMEVGDGAVITAQSGLAHDVNPGAVLSGSPAMENSVWRRAVVAFPRLPELFRRLRDVERRLGICQSGD